MVAFSPMDVPVRAVRNTTLSLEAAFFEDPGTNTVPVIPRDPTLYPGVTIRAPDGQIIYSGVARKITPGVWRFDFPVPADAPLSSEEKKWSADWVLYGATARLWEKTVPFDVVEKRIPVPEDRARTLFVAEGIAERVSIRRPKDPFELSVKLYRRLGDTATELVATYLYSPGSPSSDPNNPDAAVKRVEEGALVIFYVDTPALDAGEYIVFWDERAALTAPITREPRVLRVAPTFAVILTEDLRILIDKLQKQIGRLQAYDDGELYSYLLRGVDILNSYHPVTSFGLMDMPLQAGGTYTFLMYAAGAYAMHAQKILSVEAAFDFTGQTVPLKIDRTQGYALAYEQMMKTLNEVWPVAKYNLVRQANLLGVTGVRMLGRRFQNQVVRIDSGPAGSVLQMLSGLGLL
jgi:hypothetical protein